MTTIWVFNGAGSRFPSGVFSSKAVASKWIAERELTGVLTAYPLDEGVYEWAVGGGHFSPQSAKHASAEFIQRFTSGAQEHIHFERGRRASDDIEANDVTH